MKFVKIIGETLFAKGTVKNLVKAAIFDFDGTLANTLPDLKITLNLTRNEYGLAPVTEEDILVHVNNHMPVYIRRMIPELGAEALWDEALEKYYAFYDDHYLSETVPYAGIPEILAKLKEQGVKLAVMSNKNHSHIIKMVDALFPDTFDSVWGTIPEVPAKPNPARAYLIAEEFGLDISEIAFIGDSDVDIKTAANAGVDASLVSWGFRTAEFLCESGARVIVDTPQELYD